MPQTTYNHSEAIRSLWREETVPPAHEPPPLLSPTANLERVVLGPGGCAAYLGVGHLHHLPHRGAHHPRAPAAYSAFEFGSSYSHFFYTLEPRPPFALLATSGEFCIAARLGASDCESVQFVSGIALRATGGAPADPSWNNSARGEQQDQELVLSYGVNDCESRLTLLRLERIRRMLTPLPSAVGVCV
eukprot:239403-Prymnesium_polylepis.1